VTAALLIGTFSPGAMSPATLVDVRSRVSPYVLKLLSPTFRRT
jgi:hypothetical protein